MDFARLRLAARNLRSLRETCARCAKLALAARNLRSLRETCAVARRDQLAQAVLAARHADHARAALRERERGLVADSRRRARDERDRIRPVHARRRAHLPASFASSPFAVALIQSHSRRSVVRALHGIETARSKYERARAASPSRAQNTASPYWLRTEPGASFAARSNCASAASRSWTGQGATR